MIENVFIHQKSAKCFSTSLLEISKKKNKSVGALKLGCSFYVLVNII